MKIHRSYFFVLLASVLWGSVPATAKLLLSDLNGLQILFFSNLFAFLGLLVFVLSQKKTGIIKNYKARDYLNFGWMGFLGIFLYTLLLLTALRLLTAQEAFIINYLWPVMVVIFAIPILKEQVTLKKVLGTICSFLGVALIVTKGSFSVLQFGSMFGVLSAVAGAVIFGLFGVLGKKQNYDKLISMAFYYLVSTVCALVVVLMFSAIPALTTRQFLGLVWFGTFTSGLAFVFWFLAMKHGDTAKVANMILLTPFVSLIYIYFLVGEKILTSSVAGLFAIVVGILLQSIEKDKILFFLRQYYRQ